MNTILPLLCQLDEVYHTDLAAYEKQWQLVALQVETLCPGFTLAYGEVYTQGQERIPTGSMRHVLVSEKEAAIHETLL